MQAGSGRTWIAVAGVAFGLITFLSGWYTGQRVAWTESGQQLEKIRALEAYVERNRTEEMDQENRLYVIGSTAQQANSEVNKLRDDVRELYRTCRGVR